MFPSRFLNNCILSFTRRTKVPQGSFSPAIDLCTKSLSTAGHDRGAKNIWAGTSLTEMSNLRPLTKKDSRFNKKSHSSGPWHQFCKSSKNISPTVVVVTHPRRCAHLFLPAHYPLVSEGQMAAEEKKANWGPSWRLPLDPDEA
jgi:hypothetical protein